MEKRRRERILILAKTYPSPSSKYSETSCVAGITDNGVMRRLFPVPFRLIERGQQFKKWQWIETLVEKAPADHRRESHKIYVDTISCHETIEPKRNWTDRLPWIDRIPSFTNFDDIEASRLAHGTTLALLRPRQLVGPCRSCPPNLGYLRRCRRREPGGHHGTTRRDGRGMRHRDLVSEESIGGKPVFVFERHNYALIPWARIARATRGPVRLLTLDYHTDTRPAFVGHACQQFPGHHVAEPDEWGPLASSEIAAIRVDDDESVEVAVTRLRHDEHIDAAVRSGILDLAFVVANHDHGHIVSNEQLALDNAPGRQLTIMKDGNPVTITIPNRCRAEPPFTYTIPDSRIVIMPKRHDYPWLESDDDDRSYLDAAVDSRFLGERLELIDRICTTGGVPGLFELPFVLDIDLDYFNTRKAISPKNAQVFHKIIRNAAAITIARETRCVEDCQLEGEQLTSAFLEQKVKEHIAAALAQ